MRSCSVSFAIIPRVMNFWREESCREAAEFIFNNEDARRQLESLRP